MGAVDDTGLFRFDRKGRPKQGGSLETVMSRGRKRRPEGVEAVEESRPAVAESPTVAVESPREALGRALKQEGYFVDAGASVVLSKDNVRSMGFVLGNGAWNQPGTVAGFETLVRKVAPAVGGLPVDRQLLSPEMEIEKDIKDLR